MGRIVLTGAAGLIGSALVPELAGRHELVLIDRRPVSGWPSLKADLSRDSRWPSWIPQPVNPVARWTRSFAGATAVLHLAANRSPAAEWRSVLRNNIVATWNVLEAARSHRVPRVVYASSHHAAWGWDPEFSARARDDTGGALGEEVIGRGHRPLTPYGLSKAWGELAGRMYVEAGWLRAFVAVRIGTYSSAPPPGPEPNRWVEPAELRWILSRCLEVDLSGFQVIYGVTSRPGSLGTPDRIAALLGLRT